MKVTIDRDDLEGDTIMVRLNNGKEIGRYCIVFDAASEARQLRGMLNAVRKEAIAEVADAELAGLITDRNEAIVELAEWKALVMRLRADLVAGPVPSDD